MLKDRLDLHKSGTTGVRGYRLWGGGGGRSGEAEDNVPDTFPSRILSSSSLLSRNMTISNMMSNILEKHGAGQLGRSCEKRRNIT